MYAYIYTHTCMRVRRCVFTRIRVEELGLALVDPHVTVLHGEPHFMPRFHHARKLHHPSGLDLSVMHLRVRVR